MDPNPQYHSVTILDKLKYFIVECVWPLVSLGIYIRRKGRGRISVEEELYYARFR
jgi:hypothetical protein